MLIYLFCFFGGSSQDLKLNTAYSEWVKELKEEGIDYTNEQFDEYVSENNLNAPKFIIMNQQGRRFIQEEIFRVYPDGSIQYFERFTVTLQAPDFDFRKFPFDPQSFFVKLIMLKSLDYYVFAPGTDYPSIGKKLGEEEWLIYDHNVLIGTKTLKNE